MPHFTSPTAFPQAEYVCISPWGFQITQRGCGRGLHPGGQLTAWKDTPRREPIVLMSASQEEKTDSFPSPTHCIAHSPHVRGKLGHLFPWTHLHERINKTSV